MDNPGNCVPLNVDSAGAAGEHGQVSNWTIDLTTPPWITAHFDVAVNHTTHMLATNSFSNNERDKF